MLHCPVESKAELSITFFIRYVNLVNFDILITFHFSSLFVLFVVILTYSTLYGCLGRMAVSSTQQSFFSEVPVPIVPFTNNRGIAYTCANLAEVDTRVAEMLAGNVMSSMRAIVVVRLSAECWHVMPAFKPLNTDQRLRGQTNRDLYDLLREVYPDLRIELRFVKICGDRFMIEDVQDYEKFIQDPPIRSI